GNHKLSRRHGIGVPERRRWFIGSEAKLKLERRAVELGEAWVRLVTLLIDTDFVSARGQPLDLEMAIIVGEDAAKNAGIVRFQVDRHLARRLAPGQIRSAGDCSVISLWRGSLRRGVLGAHTCGTEEQHNGYEDNEGSIQPK